MDLEAHRRLLELYIVQAVPNGFQFKTRSFVCLTINWTEVGAQAEHAPSIHKGNERRAMRSLSDVKPKKLYRKRLTNTVNFL